MTVGSPYTQDPTARLDYPLDWNAPKEKGGPYLEVGDSIESCTARIDPAAVGITVEDPVTVAGNVTTAWVVTTGAAPDKYNLVYSIVTTSGREDERTRVIKVADQ